MALLTEFNFRIDRHVIRATNDILAQARKIADDDGRVILKSAERLTLARSSNYKTEGPFGVLKIAQDYATKLTGEGTLIQRTVELVLDLRFQMPTRDEDRADVDIFAWADGLKDQASLYLQPKLDDNPLGMTMQYPSVWGWCMDTNYKFKIDRRVTDFENHADLTGSWYNIPLPLKIEVFPTVALT